MSFATNAEQLKLAAENWPPYINEDAEDNGFLTDVIVSALNHAGYQPSLVFLPWSQALEQTKSGSVDVLLGAWFSTEREKYFAYSQPILNSNLKLIGYPEYGSFVFDGIESLKGMSIGVVEDYVYSENTPDLSGITIVEYASIKDALESLFDGEVDLVIADERVARYYLDKYWHTKIKSLKFLETPFSSKPLYIAVSRETPDYQKVVDEFNVVIEKMKESGEMNKIAGKHRFTLY